MSKLERDIEIARMISNARKLGHGAHVAAAAIQFTVTADARSLCAWCCEDLEINAPRSTPRSVVRLGGECQACPYIGPDCLIVVV